MVEVIYLDDYHCLARTNEPFHESDCESPSSLEVSLFTTLRSVLLAHSTFSSFHESYVLYFYFYSQFSALPVSSLREFKE